MFPRSVHQRKLTRQRGSRLADVLGRAVQELLGGEPREAVAALVRRPGAAVPRRQPPVPPSAVVALLAVGEAGLGVAEGAHAAVAVAVARGVLWVFRVRDIGYSWGPSIDDVALRWKKWLSHKRMMVWIGCVSVTVTKGMG